MSIGHNLGFAKVLRKQIILFWQFQLFDFYILQLIVSVLSFVSIDPG